jgi:hypothetical protein
MISSWGGSWKSLLAREMCTALGSIGYDRILYTGLGVVAGERLCTEFGRMERRNEEGIFRCEIA